jgi:ABC-type Mn2+/Zn2+ transport system permease subunit
MVEWLIEPLTYGFILRGLAAGILASLACATLSAFVVWRGMAFAGDAVAHSILPGIVIAYMFGFSMFIGAIGAAAAAVAGIGIISRRRELQEDTAIGVMFAGLFALGILLLSRVAAFQDLNHILFGNILGVNRTDLIIMAIIAAVVVLLVLLFYKELLVTSFDPAHSVAIGLSPELIRYGLLGAVALTTVIAVQSVGVVLVLALLITPAAAASLLSKKLSKIIILSIIFSLFSTIVGFYGSYYMDLSSGPAIVITLTLLFMVSWIIAVIRNRIQAGKD